MHVVGDTTDRPMRAILIIARLTVAETARRRILAVLFALTVVSVALTTWGIERLVTLARDGGTPDLEIVLGVSQVQILVAFMFSFVLAMTAAFLGAPAIAADLDSGVAHAMLARPIRRADLIVGRWLGLVVVIAAYAASSGLLEIAAVRLVSGYTPPAAIAGRCLPGGPGGRPADVRDAAEHAAAGDRRRGDLRRRCSASAGWPASSRASGDSSTRDPWSRRPRRRAGSCRATGCGGGRSTTSSRRSSSPARSSGAGEAADANPFFASAPPPATFLAWSVAWIVVVLVLAVVSLRRRDL